MDERDPRDVLGRRVVAALVDLMVLALTFVAASALTGEAKAGDGGFSVRLHGAAAVVWVVFSWTYYFACEAAWGQTPGKRALGIRVVSEEEGDHATAGEIALRTALRIVDGLPFLYLLGFYLIATSGPRQQRLGDRAAHTFVVRA